MKSLPNFISATAIACLLAVACHGQTSQEDPTDIQGWFGAGFHVNWPRKWSTRFDYQSRFINNLNTYNGSYFSIEVEKKIIPHLSLMAEYRLARVLKGTYHRYTFGGELADKKKKWDLGFRLLVQNQLQDFIAPSKPDDNSFYWRTRFKGEYSLSRSTDAYFSFEPIMQAGGRHFVDNIRNTAGMKFKLTKGLKMDIYYIYRPDFAKSYNRTFHIVGTDFIYTLNKKKASKGKKD